MRSRAASTSLNVGTTVAAVASAITEGYLGSRSVAGRRKRERGRIGNKGQRKLYLDSPEVNLFSEDPGKEHIDPNGGGQRGQLKTRIAITSNGEGCNDQRQYGRVPTDREAGEKTKEEPAAPPNHEDSHDLAIPPHYHDVPHP